MPKLPDKIIVLLGTFELMDFTWGTAKPFFNIFYDVPDLRLIDKLLWRIENILRCLEWTLYLKRHKILYRFINKIRDMIFGIAWYLIEIR